MSLKLKVIKILALKIKLLKKLSTFRNVAIGYPYLQLKISIYTNIKLNFIQNRLFRMQRFIITFKFNILMITYT